ncbi:hypothetical protein [Crateriforma conspicua]|uniref:Uncharacterized protein n=1 Tax=Crateriforma conspicua TaxID=2527996 RepID=A0A5C6FIY4_9PLAN|nr:hypothetical protein [Crateriforma conspicua]TWU59614.1 hypothetical protein V7x_55240 [Crateriforma conspicua]
MAISEKELERAATLAVELLEITGGRFKENGKSTTFVEIEQEAYGIGDIITSPTDIEPIPCPPDHQHRKVHSWSGNAGSATVRCSFLPCCR